MRAEVCLVKRVDMLRVMKGGWYVGYDDGRQCGVSIGEVGLGTARARFFYLSTLKDRTNHPATSDKHLIAPHTTTAFAPDSTAFCLDSYNFTSLGSTLLAACLAQLLPSVQKSFRGNVSSRFLFFPDRAYEKHRVCSS
jgi:hypothetical protein